MRGLEISETKSRIVDLNNEKFEFLGWEISIKYRNKTLNNQSKSGHTKILIIKPTKKTLLNIKINIKTIFSSYKPLIDIVKDLNLKLRRWLNFYRTSSHSGKAFQVLTNYIYLQFWVWAKKMHPKRSKKWLYKNYIFKTKERLWNIGTSNRRDNLIQYWIL